MTHNPIHWNATGFKAYANDNAAHKSFKERLKQALFECIKSKRNPND